MADAFLAEIRLLSFNFAPKGWALCSGQLLPINQNQALFSLMGTTYGGDGRVNFALPDLRGRIPIHMGSGHTLGERGGEENHTLIASEMPAHLHTLGATSATGDVTKPLSAYPAGAAPTQIYSAGTNGSQFVAMSSLMVSNTGGSQPHANMQPYLVLNYAIALQGIFPSQN